jgi:zinc/manganese transport system permease protein
MNLIKDLIDFAASASSLFQYDFMNRAILACAVSSLIAPSLGIFLTLRRMSLMGDALSHAILPGVAIAYFFLGFSSLWMAVGGLAAGIMISFLSTWVHRNTNLKEDTSFAAFYILSLAGGVFLISLKGSNKDLLHILFGSPLMISTETLQISLFLNLFTLLVFFVYYRQIVLDVFDNQFYESIGGNSFFIQVLFLSLVVFSLVGNFQSHGTLLTMGQMILPAIVARIFCEQLLPMMFFAALISLLGSIMGLIISFQYDLPTGPTTLLIWGFIYLLVLLFHPTHGTFIKYLKLKHFKS